MLDNEDSENLKKRKEGGPGCNVEASPHKTSKLHASSSQHEESSQSSTQTQSQSSQEMAVQEDKEKDTRTLDLQSGNVFTKLIEVFSEENPPEKMTYNKNGYNLTGLYDEFWTTFYNSSQHSRGHGSKLPRAQSLTDLELRSMARIIKRGWEDERYWPKKLSPPFLESCLFQGENSNQILTPDMFLEFIEPSEKSVIQNLRNVDQNVLDILKNYSCENTVCIEEDLHNSCIKAAKKIMIEDMRPIVGIWNQYLNGLMSISKFNFLMKDSLNFDLLDTKDLHNYKQPHKLWHTFFLGWPENKITYYKRLLCNDKFGEICNFCKDPTIPFDAKHFISVCKETLETIRLERHDAVLRKIEKKLCEAIDRREIHDSYFSKGTDWKVVPMYGNLSYEWPDELGVSFSLYPHMLVYSMSPKRRLLVVEYSISWEHWIELEKEKLSEKYNSIKVKLEATGFEVEYHVFVLGSRGVFSPELYDLFDKILKMKHSEISQTLEEISKEILHIPYKSYKEENLG